MAYQTDQKPVDALWDDLRVPVNATKKGGAKEPEFKQFQDNGTTSQGVYAMHFDDTAEEELFFDVQVPHDWKIGTDLHAHVHWSPTVDGAAAETVSWGLEYTFSDIGVVFPVTQIAYGITHIPLETLVAKKHYITEIVEIDMSGITDVSSMVKCRIFRDATSTGKTDNYGHDAALHEIDFHYQRDSLGSRLEYTK